MDRESLYYNPEGALSTFAKDEQMPNLPLPKLEETLERYYETLKPFGTEDELKNSRKIIENFKKGVGKDLHKVLVEKAKNTKNWVEKWWDDYAYLSFRAPLLPYCTMAMPLIIASANVEESTEYALKGAARVIHHGFEFYDLIKKEKLKPSANPDGSVTFSSYLFKRFYNTVRIPGEVMDEVKCYFKTEKEGRAPTNFTIIGKGRIFSVDSVNPDGTWISVHQILLILQRIRAIIDSGDVVYSIPLLSCDDRTNWAKNRNYVTELSQKNKEIVETIDRGLMVLCLDENSPTNYAETSVNTVAGDLHSKWADKSSILTLYKNGKMGCIGEHCCYDGTISMSYSFFVLLSLMEGPEPDWNEKATSIKLPEEMVFDLDKTLEDEIRRMKEVSDDRQHCIKVSYEPGEHFGKDYMKSKKIHPDAFVQMVLQLAYYNLHEEFVPTYETATMRAYYNGRTETVRSCSQDSVNFVLAMNNPNETNENRLKLFKAATDKQHKLMNEARKGNGVDRHLFGLWCAAFENDQEIPELYSDPLYTKSGGGGNFTLSTSTLGYTINVGFVAPMTEDGYGFFYSMTPDKIWMVVSAYRDSKKTSGAKLSEAFSNAMLKVKEMFEESNQSKL